MITQATLKDAKALITLENGLFGADDFPMSRGSFYYHIKRNDLFVYRHDNKIAGYILWLKRKTYIRLYSLGVAKALRGQGVAEALLAYSFEHLNAPTYTLEVKMTNSSALKLYVKNGFTQQKILSKYYPDCIDGYRMIKQI